MKLRLEVVVVPVSDVDRAKSFYAGTLGFTVDHDTAIDRDRRLIQLTPPGSACSITVGTVGPTGLAVTMPPGSLQGLQLVVADLRAAHADLAGRGVDVGEIQVYDQGALRVSRDGDRLEHVGFFFTDPDGNTWTVQQVAER